MEDLVELSDVVRRVVAARVGDPRLVEDLTQEALVHVAASARQLSPQERQAYAITTARNLVIDHARSEGVHLRHVHRLVDYTALDGPEHLTLQREETGALATALGRLDPDDRDLLLRHEVEGMTTETLAAHAGTSAGAIAMRLARARAALRVEFLLAFRHAELPTVRCRPALLALSAGDKRLQERLRVRDHLAHCETCAELAPPVSLRRRSIAGSLIVPIGEAIRRAVGALRHNRTVQAVTAVTTGAAVVAIILLTRTSDPPAAVPAAPPVTTAQATTTTAAPPPTTATPPPTAAASTQPPCPPPAPLDQIDATTAAQGCAFTPTTLVVTDVPLDEAFRARTPTGQVVWVQLGGDGESAVDIAPGQILIVSGTIDAPPPDSPAATDPGTAGAGYMLNVPYSAVAAG